MADDKIVTYSEGDIVFYADELYRVNVVGGEGVYIANTNGSTKVLANELTYVGKDTLSAIAVKEMKPKEAYRWRCGDWVKNLRLGLIGEVIENRDGKTKCEVALSDGGHKLYWWPQHELTTALEPYRAARNTGGDYKYKNYDIPRREPAPVKAPVKKNPGLDISTAGLIKNEVSKLENEQKTRPLKTTAPTKKKDDDIFDGPSKPVPKRKGDW